MRIYIEGGIILNKSILTFGLCILLICSAIIPSSIGYINKKNTSNLEKETEEGFKKIINNNNINPVIIIDNYEFCDSCTSEDNWDYPSNWKNIPNNKIALNNDEIYFTTPLNNDIFRAGDTIEIVGTITGNKFKNYLVEYGVGIDPTEWKTTGITLMDEGYSSIINDTVAVWNTSHITEPEFYTLRITTNFKNSRAKSFLIENNKNILFPRIQKLFNIIFKKPLRFTPKDNQKINYIQNIYLDPSLKEGWPQRLYKTYPFFAGPTEPVAADIDNDDELELLVYFYSLPPKIYAYNPDGTMVDGFPAEIDASIEYSGAYYSPSIYDIDNDNSLEIVVSGREGIYIYNNDGSLQNKIDYDVHNPCQAENLIYDLNNDGDIEIIRKDSYYNYNPTEDFYGLMIWIFDINGNVLPNWPQLFDSYINPDGTGYSHCRASYFDSAPAVGNFDDDSDMEIVIAGYRNVFDDPNNCYETWHCEGRVTVYNMDGSIIPGFPKDLNGTLKESPSVGDINNDGFDEIVIGTSTLGWENSFLEYGLFVIDRYGNYCQGWPKMINKRVTSSAALADINNDSFLEIIVGIQDDNYNPATYVFDYLGNIYSGWPQSMSWYGHRSPVIGDVDGDGILDIIQTAGNGVFPDNYYDGGVYAWNIDGTLIDGFPKVTEIDAQAAATIADIDNDGSVELIASSCFDEDFQNYKSKYRSSIYVWELNNDYYEETMEWPMFHHDPQHTGYYALDFPILIKNYLK